MQTYETIQIYVVYGWTIVIKCSTRPGSVLYVLMHDIAAFFPVHSANSEEDNFHALNADVFVFLTATYSAVRTGAAQS